MSLQKIIIGLLLVLSVMELRAQDTLFIAAAKMDSLKKLVLSHEGEEKVKLLNQYAQYSLFNGEIIKGFTLVLEAYDLSKEIGFKEGE
ncbi:hypothetical protein, partial [Lutimonas sp.]|uniref:hypothetical protein n=1 Tax=Lutimonas sp. TaxID=1872403 RepID=UPI003D9BBB7C